GAGRSAGSRDQLQDRELPRHLDLEQGTAAGRRREAEEAARAGGRRGRRRRGRGPGRQAGEEEAQPEAPPRAPAARSPLLGLRRVPGLKEDAGDPLLSVRDAHLLAAREPASDPPRQLGHAHHVWRLQARRDRGGPPRRRARARRRRRKTLAARDLSARDTPTRPPPPADGRGRSPEGRAAFWWSGSSPAVRRGGGWEGVALPKRSPRALLPRRQPQRQRIIRRGQLQL